MKRSACFGLLTLLCAGLTLTACGGGGGNVGGGMMGGTLTPAFTPDVAVPGANSIRLDAGTVVGDTFQVQVLAANITDFFGAAFTLNFDTASAAFLSFSVGDSYLEANFAPDVEINAVLDSTDSSRVAILATLKTPLGQMNQGGIDTTAGGQGEINLLTLTFRATNPTTAPHNAFIIDPSRAREVQTCVAMGGCMMLAGVTWSGGLMTAM